MNSKQKLKVRHKVEELISLIERNDIKSIKLMVNNSRNILKKHKMDDNQPIYYAIKYRCNKIFKYILENSEEINYDVHKLFSCITEFGTEKIFKTFINFYKIDLNSVNKNFIYNLFKFRLVKTVEILLTETDFCYCYSISQKFYDVMNYNVPIMRQVDLMESIDTESNENNGNTEDICMNPFKNDIHIVLNREKDREVFNLDQFFPDGTTCRFKILFHRYKKLFLVRSKSIKPPKNLRQKDYSEIVKYL